MTYVLGIASGESHPRWKGGKSKTKKGYIQINAGPDRNKFEHRVVIRTLLREMKAISLAAWVRSKPAFSPEQLTYLLECELKALESLDLDPTFEVHHMNWKRDHNCPCNLLYLDSALHRGISSNKGREWDWKQSRA